MNRYAGFWIRVAAAQIDTMVLFLFQLGLVFALGPIGNRSLFLAGQVMGIVISFFYFLVMESSRNQGTLGKMAVGIKVGNTNGDRISFLHALGRCLPKILSVLLLFIGCVMIAFDDRKQGLHDKIANTFVFYSK